MSLFIRLSIVAAIAVLLRCVPATVVITAPSTVTDSTAGLETREQGPTAWICSVLVVDSPWISYANIRGYLEGGNAEKKDFSNFVLYPVMELFHASESRLCVYLPAEDHCYPPAPSTNQVKAVKQLSKRKYYAIRFWGQASDARVQYYKQKLTAAISTQSKTANIDLFFVSFFSDHVREVRYDYATTSQGKNAEPLTEKSLRQSFTCPTVPDYSIYLGTSTLLAGQEFLHTTLLGSRLNLSDVQSSVVLGPNGRSQEGCAGQAYNDGVNAFSFVNGACKVYQLEKSFCSCAPGDFDIYINPKLLGSSKALPTEKFAQGVEKLVIYTEIPLDNYVLSSIPTGPAKDRSQCAAIFGGTLIYSVAFLLNGTCYIGKHHDFTSCNQTCRGQPVDILVKREGPIPEKPILSLCGQKIVLPIIDNGRYVRTYFSHAGFGCYRYQGAKTAGEEDCIVTFEKDKKTAALNMEISAIGLNFEGGMCRDELSIYDGNTTADASRKFNGCSATNTGGILVTTKEAFTVKFHRGLGSEKNFGFKLLIRNEFV